MDKVSEARILVVDDHALFRQGLVSLIDSQDDMTVVGQASDGLDAVSLARAIKPDLIIMDVNMPLSDGLEATRIIRKLLPETRIVMLTIRDEDETLFEAIKAGADGYMLKIIDAETCLSNVRGALDGEAILPPTMARRFLREFSRLSQERDYAARTDTVRADWHEYELTHRELEVLELLADRLTDKEIAAQLSVSVHTVKSHVRSILSKLQASSRWEAAQRGRNAGLLGD